MTNIRRIQEALVRKGYEVGPIDGILGPKTEAAITEFKSEMKFKSRAATVLFLLDSDDEPKWLQVARSYLGLREYTGSRHNKKILEWWSKIRAPFTDDETPWCAGFVGGVLEECEIKSSRSAAARSYQKWGHALKGPVVGAVVVFWRGKPEGWSGHVGFVVGRDEHNNLMVIGGNQGNAVNIKPFSLDRVLSYQWPENQTLTNEVGFENLPLVNSDGRLSTNEA